MAMNKIFLQGRLTKEPEIRLTAKNDKVAHFKIAVDRDFNREETDFINCVAFKATAAFIESYFGKGKTKDAATGAQLAPVEDDGQLPF